MFKERFLPALVCGFGVAVVGMIPIIQAFSCCVFVPLAGGLGVYLLKIQYKDDENFRIEASDAVVIGLMIGLISAFFSTIFQTIMIKLSEQNPITDALEVLRELSFQFETPEIINKMQNDLDEHGFSLLLSLMIFLNALIINSIFAIVGGLIGVGMIKKNQRNDTFTDL